MFSGERARDGDYALNDLGSLRARPFHAARDVEGFTHRDILAPTVQIAYAGHSVDFATTTGASHFIFSTEDGTIAAWSGGTTAELKVDRSTADAVGTDTSSSPAARSNPTPARSRYSWATACAC